jgi:hypothetical protein
MGDPLTDPRAQELVSAEPGEVSALAVAFRRVAGQAETAAAGLRGAQGDATWTGQAADAFRHQLGKLPGDLDTVQRSYGAVADALGVYESQLGDLQRRFHALADQIIQARQSLSGAQTTLSGATSALHDVTAAPPKSAVQRAAVSSAEGAFNAASGAVTRIQGEISSLEGQAYRLLDEFDSDRGRTRSAVSGAAGVAPHQSWWSSVFHAVENFMEDAAKSIYNHIKDLVPALIAFVEHPTLDGFARLVEDIAVTASVIAMIAAPFAAPEIEAADAALAAGEAATEGGEAAVAGATAEATTEAATTTATATTEAATTEAATTEAATTEAATTEVTTTDATAATGDATATTDAAATGDGAATGESGSGFSTARTAMRSVSNWGGRVSTVAGATGVGTDVAQGHYGAAALDAAALVAPQVVPRAMGGLNGGLIPHALGDVPKALGNVRSPGDLFTNLAGFGDRSAAQWAHTVSGMKDFQTLVGKGSSVSDALQRAFDGEVPAGFHGIDLTSPDAVSGAIHSAASAELGAASRAMHFGRPAAGLVDKFGIEPGVGHIKRHFHLVPEQG